ncbi:hypothetical protein ACLOJK_040339 [Asimina triloba]
MDVVYFGELYLSIPRVGKRICCHVLVLTSYNGFVTRVKEMLCASRSASVDYNWPAGTGGDQTPEGPSSSTQAQQHLWLFATRRCLNQRIPFGTRHLSWVFTSPMCIAIAS